MCRVIILNEIIKDFPVVYAKANIILFLLSNIIEAT